MFFVSHQRARISKFLAEPTLEHASHALAHGRNVIISDQFHNTYRLPPQLFNYFYFSPSCQELTLNGHQECHYSCQKT